MRALLSPPGVFASAVATAFALSAPLHSQQPDPRQPPMVVPTPGNAITANDSFVYVLIGTKVFQLNARNLQVIRSIDLVSEPIDAVPEPEMEIVEEQAAEEEVVEELVGGEQVVGDFPEWNEAEVGQADAEDPKVLIARKAGKRKAVRDGERSTANAIDYALLWLVQHQDETGRWDADGFMQRDPQGAKTDGPGQAVHDVGVTGLALLALMADGNTLRSGPHHEAVKRGIKWLRDQQDPKSGLIGPNNSHEYIYDHAIASIAIIEAYGLSQLRILEPNAQRALDYLEYHRNPYSVWRYQPRDGDNDTSVTSWCAMAWKTGKDFGLQVNHQTGMLVAAWMDQMTDPVNGRTGYTERGGLSSRMPGDHVTRYPREANETMTAASLFSRYLVGNTPDQNPVMSSSADLIVKKLPTWEPDAGTVDFVAWFFGSHALYQFGGRHWDLSRKALVPALVTNQRRDATFDGSWDPCGPWGQSMGRIGSTALGALALQSAYRHARLTGD